MSGASQDTPYNGTIAGEVVADSATPTKEFYRLPLKQKNEIVIEVKAASNASILLFDSSKSSDSSNIKVEVLLGGDKNSTASIGLQNDDGTHPKELVQADRVLSATHFKVFTVRWCHGRVMVYNDGFKKPFVVWDGPKEARFSSVGIRTNGCSGDWKVQGMAVVTTADGAEYKEIVINTGRMDFEMRGHNHCSYVVFTPDAIFDKTKIIHYALGYEYNTKLGFFWNFNLGVEEAGSKFVSETEYHRFWCKWDANNFWIGRGTNVAATGEYNTPTTPLPQINYFSLMAGYIARFAYFHILDEVRPEDVAVKGDAVTSSTGGGDDANSVGYVTYTYTTTS